ncbi:AAA family ATPase [Escherichia coli]|nr:AAA family ATPase [Escherichia coli]
MNTNVKQTSKTEFIKHAHQNLLFAIMPTSKCEMKEFFNRLITVSRFEAERVIEDYSDYDFETVRNEDIDFYNVNVEYLNKFKLKLKAINNIDRILSKRDFELDALSFCRMYNTIYPHFLDVINSYVCWDSDLYKTKHYDFYKEHIDYLNKFFKRGGEVYKDVLKSNKDFENDITDPMAYVSHYADVNTAPGDVDYQAELFDMIGLQRVKAKVQEILNEIKIKNLRVERGLEVGKNRSYHMVFSGNPGTGKTVIARLLAKIFHQIGLTQSPNIVECDRAGLVGGYIGHTAAKTNEVIDKALGGVLFIDEAYTLNKYDSANDFGKEAVETLLKRMEDERENLIVIVAGYSKEMESFVDMNTGLKSRFATTLYFDDYSEHELSDIFLKMCKANGYIVSDILRDNIASVMTDIKVAEGAQFANARTVRNHFEKALAKQEARLINSHDSLHKVSNKELQTITLNDFDILK